MFHEDTTPVNNVSFLLGVTQEERSTGEQISGTASKTNQNTITPFLNPLLIALIVGVIIYVLVKQ